MKEHFCIMCHLIFDYVGSPICEWCCEDGRGR